MMILVMALGGNDRESVGFVLSMFHRSLGSGSWNTSFNVLKHCTPAGMA